MASGRKSQGKNMDSQELYSGGTTRSKPRNEGATRLTRAGRIGDEKQHLGVSIDIEDGALLVGECSIESCRTVLEDHGDDLCVTLGCMRPPAPMQTQRWEELGEWDQPRSSHSHNQAGRAPATASLAPRWLQRPHPRTG